jgi:eukaryotic-like serine/threonine-protein kinase
MKSPKPERSIAGARPDRAGLGEMGPLTAPEQVDGTRPGFEVHGAPVGPELERKLIGRVLRGKWRIERRLGSGGMSTVYAATHRNGKAVAIKVLSDEYASNAAVRRRFLREGYIANRVGHPGAVSVHDDDIEDGLCFLVMELVQGKSLETHCQNRGGRLESAEVVGLTEQLLEVLVSAHANGIVHRDVKPANLLVTPQGELRLLDFGIASLRESGGAASHTGSGTMLGTPGFMAPEQARGRVEQVDERTDIWSVGATMFRLLSGHLVHERATNQECAIATATEPAPSLASLSDGTPRGLCAVVDRALSFDPAQRFASAREMLSALRALEAPEQPDVRPAQRSLRRPAGVALLAVFSAAGLYGLGSRLLGDVHRSSSAATPASVPSISKTAQAAFFPPSARLEPSAAPTPVIVNAPTIVNALPSAAPQARHAPSPRPAKLRDAAALPRSKAPAPVASDDLSRILGSRR